MKVIVTRPYYDWYGRKYMEFDNIKVKIPYRYGRVMAKVEGLTTVQEFKKGQQVEIELTKKYWDGLEYWVLYSIKECLAETDI